MKIFNNISLKKYNTFELDVKAKKLIQINTITDLQALIKKKIFLENDFIILGEGSNILFSKDFSGVIIKNNLKGIKIIKENAENVWIEAFAGENWDQFVKYTVQNNFAGLENLVYIPGSLGAAPIQNIGAYGVEVKNRLISLNAISIKTGKIKCFSNKECKFSYRESIFKNQLKNKFIITSLTFKLKKYSKNTLYKFSLDYGGIIGELKKMKIDLKKIALKDITTAIENLRKSKLPKVGEIGSAGSFFKNPIISENQYKTLIKKTKEKIPGYKIQNNNIKISAGYLIDQCGWKGKTFIGKHNDKKFKYGVYQNHALILVNYYNATGKQILNLSEKIQKSVKNKYGIFLEPEVNIY